jgi:hypothetical protein
VKVLADSQSFGWHVGAASRILVFRLVQNQILHVQRQEFGLTGWCSIKVLACSRNNLVWQVGPAKFWRAASGIRAGSLMQRAPPPRRRRGRAAGLFFPPRPRPQGPRKHGGNAWTRNHVLCVDCLIPPGGLQSRKLLFKFDIGLHGAVGPADWLVPSMNAVNLSV